MSNINTSKGFFKMYWDLLDNDNITWEEAFFYSYLQSIFNILIDTETVDGIIYKRLADSYIQEKIEVSSPTIRKWFTDLEEAGLIKIWKPNNKKHGIRYFYIDSCNEDCNDSENNSSNNTSKDSSNTSCKNFSTKYNNINNIKNRNNILSSKEESNDSKNAKSSSGGVLKKVENSYIQAPAPAPAPDQINENSANLKDIFSYLNELDSPVKEEASNFYSNLIKNLHKRYTVKQVKEQLKQLAQQCNNDPQLITHNIHQCYIRNYNSLFFCDKNTKSSYSKAAKTEHDFGIHSTINDNRAEFVKKEYEEAIANGQIEGKDFFILTDRGRQLYKDCTEEDLAHANVMSTEVYD